MGAGSAIATGVVDVLRAAGQDLTSLPTLPEIFDETAGRWPDRVAVDVPPGRDRPHRRCVTYAELRRASDRLAARLGPVVASDAIVPIFVRRDSVQLFAAELAVLKCGAAYTCLDAALPDEQIRQILADAEPAAILLDNERRDRLKATGVDLRSAILVDDTIFDENAGSAAGEQARRVPHAGDLAYLIYTSGTTGRPKGVMIEHASIANLVLSDRREFELTPDDRVGQGSSAAYDSSIEEVWLAWAAGATVVVIDDDTVRLGPDLIPWLQRERVTVMCPPPTLLRATGCQRPDLDLPDLHLLYVGGEALPQDVADRWARGRRLVNGYGPTETTVTSVRGDVRAGEPISIGRPVDGARAYVLDDALDEVPDGAQGELCLAGVVLARGYRRLPELTAEKFPHHPVFGRIYRTGDLVHRSPDGALFYHGRLDAQVKLRGYRIELEAIESNLLSCAGVRDAACRVQVDGAQQLLAAFIVPVDPSRPPSFEDLASALRTALPAYMVPGRFQLIESLPRTVGAKLNRQALPTIEAPVISAPRPAIAPASPIELRVASAVAEVLALPSVVSVADDFFVDLGGDSLRAALLISSLRDDPATASLTVRDVYETRTVAGLVGRAGPVERPGSQAPHRERAPAHVGPRPGAHPVAATLIQGAWLLMALIAGTALLCAVMFDVIPWLAARLSLPALILLAPFFAAAAAIVYAPIALGLSVLVKKLLIGRYRPLRAPVWGSFHIRHWIVQETARILLPWRLFEGTVFQHIALRALGARIGARVHVHRGVSLAQGGWDLLDIGDDVTVAQDAAIRLIELDAGEIVVGSISLGDGCTLDVRAGAGPGTVVEAGAWLSALSSLPEGGRIPRSERWDGIPAAPAGMAPAAAKITATARIWSPAAHGAFVLAARAGLGVLLAAPLQLAALALVSVYGVDSGGIVTWLANPLGDGAFCIAMFVSIVAAVPLSVALSALLCRGLGRVRPSVINRWSLGYLPVWFKAGLVDAAGNWLSGTLFWPVWLRAAGMSIGRGCEISTIIDVVPELVEIGAGTFLADGIYLGGPMIHRGVVTLAAVRLGDGVFLGNHSVIGGGRRLADDVLLGVCTVAEAPTLPNHTAWFGHPAFALPRREVVEMDRRLTHDPPAIRYWNRVGWELLRFTLPIGPAVVGLWWVSTLARVQTSWPFTLFVVAPAITLAASLVMCAAILAMKWILLGRVRPGQHPLWSCWCSRWDFLYVAWGFYARGLLSALEGTLWLSMFLRAAGMTIGKRVVLGAGFSQVVDPDMLTFEDDATVEAQFQAHTFEDRVLKIDRVTIRRGATVASGAVLLYGADIGAGAIVAPHSVVMKKERLKPGRRYEGCPIR